MWEGEAAQSTHQDSICGNQRLGKYAERTSPKSARDFHVNSNSELPLARGLYPRSPLSFKKLKHSSPQMAKYFHF